MTWLYVDQGNSRIKWRWRQAAVSESGVAASPEALALRLKQRRVWPEGVALASVADEAARQQWHAAFPGCHLWVARVQKRLQGLSIAYDQPETLGVDRWLAMAGGWQRHRGEAFAVMDAGTAITLDLVDARGQHRGGWIAPGSRLLRRAVDTGMARVQSSEPDLSGHLGVTTQACVARGLGALLAGLVHEAEAVLATHDIDRFLVTGGDAEVIMAARRGKTGCIHVPDLVLEGLEWTHRVGMPE